MNRREIEARIKNIDERTERIEQILPTLASKDELKALATKEELKALATKEELRVAIEPLATKEELRAAIEPLATKEELRAAIEPLATKAEVREEAERTRRHFDVVAEGMESRLALIAEGHVVLDGRINTIRAELKALIANHEARLTHLEATRRG